MSIAVATSAQRMRPAAQSWQLRLREAGALAFSRLGFPSRRDEGWRHTPLAPLVEAEFSLSEPRFRLPENVPDGVTVLSLAEALRRRPSELEPHLGRLATPDADGFAALSAAFLQDGVFVHVAGSVSTPIELGLISPRAGEMAHPRVLMVMEDGASATLIERVDSQSGGAALINRVTEVVLGEGATLEHYQLLPVPEEVFFVGLTAAEAGPEARYSCVSIAQGGRLLRNELLLALGRGSVGALSGLGLARGKEHIGHHATITHHAAEAKSREAFRHLIGGDASAIFAGSVVVRKGAQKTDAVQSTKSLLLSDNATAYSQPHLEIYADDVKCAHGATTGQLNEEALFYLSSRGIPTLEARAMLAYAFAGDIVALITADELRRECEALVKTWLRGQRD